MYGLRNTLLAQLRRDINLKPPDFQEMYWNFATLADILLNLHYLPIFLSPFLSPFLYPLFLSELYIQSYLPFC